MIKKVRHIFNPSLCPAEKELVEYAKGRLSAEQRHEIELHITDCEMCSDFVEGLSMMSDPDQLHSIVSELNRNIDAIASNRPFKRFFNFRTISVVAALLIVLVVATFILQKQFSGQKQEMAEFVPDQEKSTSSTLLHREELSAPGENDSRFSTAESGKKAPPVISDIEYAEQEYDDGYFMPVTTTGSVTRNVLNYDKVAEHTDKKNVLAQDVEVDETAVVALEERAIEDTRTLNHDHVISETISMAQVVSKEYRKTEDQNVSGKSAAGMSESNEGIMLYDAGHYQASLLFFENVLKTNPLDREAQWYYALNLIKLQRTDEAIKVLQAIISAGGKYKKQAEREIKKLQE